MNAFHTPVVVFAYNRPRKVRRLLEILSVVRPSILLVAADGPRDSEPDDFERCQHVRALLQRIDWPCEVLRDYSETNLGPDRRIPAAIDWAFGHVAEAILLEDDVLPHPSFFPWCEEMLNRYRDSETVYCISGRNNLGRWRAEDDDHHLIFRGSNWGCATWRRAWRQAREVCLPGPDDTIPKLLAEGRIDPWVARHLEMFRGMASRGQLQGWDCVWELQRGLLGGLSAVSSVNLIAHAGFDDEATHAFNADSFRGIQPVGRAPGTKRRKKDAPDPILDRWSLFIELLDNCRHPRLVGHLSRSQIPAVDDRARYYLGPFTAAADSLSALNHLRELGVQSARLDTFIEVLERLARRQDRIGSAP